MAKAIKERAKKMPVIALVGPRQSGKTTLSRMIFKGHAFVSLETAKVRERAQEDPQTFLDTHANKYGIILDEIQEVPELLSYIKEYVDTYNKPGYFIITGSQNFLVNEAITQTLAGRVAIFTLLPLCVTELNKAKLLPATIDTLLFSGQYPRTYAQKVDPLTWYPDYVRTYVERDIRTLRYVTDLLLFQKFIGLCAGRIGQLLNLTSLANDCGVTVITVKSWLSLLEASYIIFLLQPYHVNLGKRLTKTPKLYFYDTGLACSVLGIESEKQLAHHYIRGNLFESFILAEFYKQRYNQGLLPRMYFWRDKTGHEIDCLLTSGETITPIEIKAGQTVSSNYFDGLTYWYELNKQTNYNGYVVYTGSENQKRKYAEVTSWKSLDAIKNR
jgi:predicted AAA+ superfamily ATPase